MDDNGLSISTRDFRFLASLVYERSRIVLKPEKRNMLAGRLTRRIRALGLSGFADYCALVASPKGSDEIGEMINAVTTNLTSFFREPHHFEHLAQVSLPAVTEALKAQGTNRLRLWSAGCSSGQEPYSMAMTIAAKLPSLSRWNARILATDLDTAIVARAEAGHYSEEQATGIPKHCARQFTRRNADGSVDMGQALRDLITFKPLNLMDEWPMKGPFDIIFCRNVAIYFDSPTQAELFDRLADIMAPHGWLYIGHSESLFAVTDRFELVGKTTYRKRSAP
jgi:chemotaxis protein methyltransferase CheR